MLNDFRKSIQSVLYERVRSPFSGAFFFSWFAWNWKLIYYLLLSNNSIPDRFIFVEENYINIYTNLLFPFLSTIFLIVLYPFITTAGYWVWLKFKTWQTDIRNEIEKTQRLSIEESLEIKMQLRNQEIEIEKILRKKDEEILLLRKQLKECNESKEQGNELINEQEKLEKKDSSIDEFLNFQHSNYYEYFNDVIEAIQSYKDLFSRLPKMAIAYYESNEIIETSQGVLHKFTPKGRRFVKYHLDTENEEN